MTDEKTIVRNVNGRYGFSYPTQTAQDGRRDSLGLTFGARGLMAYLLSKPDNWKIVLSDIQAEGGIGRDKAMALLKELRDGGYLVTEMIHDKETGKILGKIDRVHEVYKARNHHTGNPHDGKTIIRKNRSIHTIDNIPSDSVNQLPLNGDSSNKDTEVPDSNLLAAPTGGARKKRPQDFIFDAIVAAAGLDPATVTGQLGKTIGMASADLYKAGFTPDEMKPIYDYVKAKRFPSFGALALAKYAPEWKAQRVGAAKPNPDNAPVVGWTPEQKAASKARRERKEAERLKTVRGTT